MIDIFFYLTSVLFFIWLVKNTLFWIYLWQIKEYRFDRLKIHLNETKQGRKLFTDWQNILKCIVFLLYIPIIIEGKYTLIYTFLVFSIYFISLLQTLREVINRKIKFPVLTLKTFFIFFFALSIAGLLFIFPLLDKFFWLILIDRLIPLIIAVLIGTFSIPSDFYKEIIIYKAIKKRNKFSPLVIGITGSYGKGSTKEYLYSILSYKFNVLKTFGTFNTPIGVAKTILKDLDEKKEIFVVEMGAYKIGEIREMCSIVKPKIGILTAVNDQHISLFGSLENTMKAKYELIESLSSNGVSLFNANNQNSLELSKKNKRNKIIYFTDYLSKKSQSLKEKNNNFDIIATNIKMNKFNICFDINIKDKFISSCKVNLIGQHNIENLLPGIFIAYLFGMKFVDIKNALKKIFPLKKVMEPFVDSKGLVLIDDTFNTNPAAVLAVLEYMKIFKGKKILILQPMIELGKNASFDHYDIALKIGKICDYLILTNDNFVDIVEKGVEASKGECIIKILNPKETAQFIKENFGKNDISVFEGKEAGMSLSLLDHENVYS